MRRLVIVFLMVSVTGMAFPAWAREQIRIVGSGTLYPFVTIAAEQFGQGGKYLAPIVESTGTGGGFKLFCQGAGSDTPDITNASRKITASEYQKCAASGVMNPVEIQLGYDGIVLANKKGGASLNLTKKQIFMALARVLPDSSGKLVPNPYQNWHEIDASLPDQPIKVYGPGTVSGTRDAFAELVMEKGCEPFEAFAHAYSDAGVRKKICQAIREDGKYVESGEDYNVMVQKLVSNEQALGIFGYGFYSQNRSQIQASLIDGIAPGNDTITSGKYGISRGLYVYVKRQHLGKIPGIEEFIEELGSEDAIGSEGYLTSKGLIPLNAEDRKTVATKILTLSTK